MAVAELNARFHRAPFGAEMWADHNLLADAGCVGPPLRMPSILVRLLRPYSDLLTLNLLLSTYPPLAHAGS